MKNILLLLVFSFSLFTFNSCVKEDFYDDTRRGNYEALWRIMNERYCFFEYKQKELGVDWDEIPLVKPWLNHNHRLAMDTTTQKQQKKFSENQLECEMYKKES